MANSDVELEEVAIDPIKSLLDLVDDGRNRGNQLQPSICMVPRIYRNQIRGDLCFDPQVVSIGPLHKGHENVQDHEGLKGAYMCDLLARLDSPPQQTLERCLFKVNSSIKEIKLCYGGINNYLDVDVAKMMVTDACFILEFIQKISVKDPVLCSENMFTRNGILTDLLLIENQIPFFVLQDIFDLTLMKIQDDSLITLLLNHVLFHHRTFIADLEFGKNFKSRCKDEYKFKHILEILHESCRPDSLPEPYYGSPERRSHPAVELDRAGVKFEPNQGENMAIDMKVESFGWLWFFRKATLRIPTLYICDKTQLIFRNLVAYEQSYPNIGCHYFTSLAIVMDMLVDREEDVAKLVESKVIVNDLGCNFNVADMINSICYEVTCVNFIYEKQLKDLDDYYKSYWPKNMAWLRRTYFNSPWNVIALVAGILLFVLTAIQTIFTVMSA